jgi:hypothetical protein
MLIVRWCWWRRLRAKALLRLEAYYEVQMDSALHARRTGRTEWQAQCMLVMMRRRYQMRRLRARKFRLWRGVG